MNDFPPAQCPDCDRRVSVVHTEDGSPVCRISASCDCGNCADCRRAMYRDLPPWRPVDQEL